MAQPYDHGPIQSFEITWQSGHVETIHAHQVSWPDNARALFGPADSDPFVRFHGQIGGRWRLVFQARELEIRSIRNVTDAEPIPGEHPMTEPYKPPLGPRATKVRATPVRVARVHTDPDIEPDRDAQWRTPDDLLVAWDNGWWISAAATVIPWRWKCESHHMPLVEVLPEDEPTPAADSNVEHDDQPTATAMPVGYEQRRTALRDAMLLLGEADLPGTGVADWRGLAAWLLGDVEVPRG